MGTVRRRKRVKLNNAAWSSARAHLAGRDDGLVRVAPLLERAERFADLIDTEADHVLFSALRESEAPGRLLGSDDFIAEAERRIGRRLQKRKPGRKSSDRGGAEQLELGKVSR